MLNPRPLPNMHATSKSHLMDPIVGISQKYELFAAMDVIQILDSKFLPGGFCTHVLWIWEVTSCHCLCKNLDLLECKKWCAPPPPKCVWGLCGAWNSQFHKLPSSRFHYLKVPWQIDQQYFEVLLPTPANFVQQNPWQLSTLCTNYTIKHNFFLLNSPQSIVLQV